MANLVTQSQAEVFVVPDNQQVRVTQSAAEVFVVPDNQRVRVTQSYVEVFVKDSLAGGGERFWSDIAG